MKKREELKLFVGGYYDDRIFQGDGFEGKTPFSKDIEVYTLNELLKLSFVENVKVWYREENGKEWEKISFIEKITAIINYTDLDEISGLLYFQNENEAKKYKDEVIKEVIDLEKKIEYVGKKQDEYGYYREVYKLVE